MNRRSFLRLGFWYGLAAAGGYSFGYEPDRLVTRTPDVELPGLDPRLDGLRVGLLSDFHNGWAARTDLFESACEATMACSPDVVCLLGDYIHEESSYMPELAEILGTMRAPLGVHAVLGNHDFRPRPRPIFTALAEQGIPTYRNESVLLEHEGARIHLGGSNSMTVGKAKPGTALADAHESDLALLLVHEPALADYVVWPYESPLVQLSGHTHGGQVKLPWIGPPYLPPLGEKYVEGFFPHIGDQNMHVYTTTGVGSVLSLRVNCPPEVVCLTLRRSTREQS